jgi:hypothetical protein
MHKIEIHCNAKRQRLELQSAFHPPRRIPISETRTTNNAEGKPRASQLLGIGHDVPDTREVNLPY